MESKRLTRGGRPRVVVIGAGAAGLVAAAEAANRGADVTLLEKNRKTGVKILMSGGTRCNLTQDTDARGIGTAFGHARRFLQPSVGAFPPSAVVAMFEAAGVATKVESTGKIFPQSNRAVDVRDALQRRAVDAGVAIRLGVSVTGLTGDATGWMVQTAAEAIDCDRVIVTSGGQSWPGCGTTGDGYEWLRQLGHTIVTPRPALVPLVGGYDWTRALSGITLDDTLATVRPRDAKRKRVSLARRGSWLFTHFGFSGPAAMDVSGVMTAAAGFDQVALELDLIPDQTESQLRAALTRRDGGAGAQRLSTVVAQWLPGRLAEALVGRSGDDPKLAELPGRTLRQLISDLKGLPLPISGTRGFAKAEVTAGGVALGEVDPRTMASRVADGLYIAGEVLDVDGWIGGYNFQAAFSTGRAAGIAAAEASPRENG